MVELIHSARHAGITAEYVLFDSWFSAPKIIRVFSRSMCIIIDALMDTVMEYFYAECIGTERNVA